MQNNILPRVRPYLLLDAWRGVAALWVVMIHSCLAYIANHPKAAQNPVFSISLWGQLGVVMFFIISGYCISGAGYNCICTGKSLKRYALDRIRRIYPPYLGAFIAILLVTILISLLQHWHILYVHSTFKLPRLKDFYFWLSNLTLTQVPMGYSSLLIVSWSLCYEVAFYVLIGGFLSLSTLAGLKEPPHRSRFLGYACIITTIFSLIWLLFSPNTCPFPFDRWYQFGFGTILFTLASSGRGHLYRFIWISAVGCVILCTCYACCSASSVSDLGHPSVRVQALTCILFFFILVLLQPFNEKLSRWRPIAPFMWLGTFSYSIYLVHLIVIPFADAGLRRAGFDGSLYIFTYFAQLLVGIGAGWLFFILVEKHFISARQEKRIAVEQRIHTA
jgi:exopolysaccharide production protein ExoZ